MFENLNIILLKCKLKEMYTKLEAFFLLSKLLYSNITELLKL